MKKFTKFAFLVISVVAISFTACKEDDDEESTPELTAEQKITGNTFLITDEVIEYNGMIVSTFDSLDACDQDDLITFNSGGTGVFDEGATKCDPSDPQSDPFTWFLSGDTKMTVIQQGDSIPLGISRNDGNILQLQLADRDGSDTTTITITYTKQ